MTGLRFVAPISSETKREHSDLPRSLAAGECFGDTEVKALGPDGTSPTCPVVSPLSGTTTGDTAGRVGYAGI